MIRRFASVATLSALALWGTSAWAASYSLGTLSELPAYYSNVSSVSGTSFEDTYSFELASTANTSSASAVSLDLSNLFNIDNVTIALYDSAGTLLQSSSSGDAALLLVGNLVSGQSYVYRVTGDITGSQGGTYSFLATSTYASSIITNVPEPGSLALSGCSLLMLAAARRRRPQTSGSPWAAVPA